MDQSVPVIRLLVDENFLVAWSQWLRQRVCRVADQTVWRLGIEQGIDSIAGDRLQATVKVMLSSTLPSDTSPQTDQPQAAWEKRPVRFVRAQGRKPRASVMEDPKASAACLVNPKIRIHVVSCKNK